ncbi:unnamed protein product [Pieris macdunnoughi]|uniref:O-acyltransferase WSD1 C-terminal domain-containing protein n=1 Tax=Pieris macdunnoughi TaxID=345717 RepID=A0A821QC32_9NEOP|nr:unnamed protein product [Pieris macdunnoughi]
MENYLRDLEKGIVFPDTIASDLVDRVSDRIGYLIHNLSCVLAVVMSFLLGFEYDKVWNKVKLKIDDKGILRISVLVVLFFLLPALLIFILLSLIYKNICSVIIKGKDEHFVSFLESFDVFWSLDDANKNVIEVLGFIEADSPDALILNIRERLNHLVGNAAVEKIFYRRLEQFGLYYWHRPDTVDVSQYVKILKISNTSGLSKRDLETIMTQLSEDALPYDGEGLFEILVADIQITEEAFLNNYAIMFRIHHSVGDGIALIEFLCKILADESDINLFKPPEVCNLIEENLAKDLVDLLSKLKEIIMCTVDGVIRKPDLNSLHGPKLEGKKHFKWIDTNYNLLDMIKEIKESQSGLNFTDILATALSSGLRDYFSQTMLYVPDDVAVIIPIRLSESDRILKNNFTVTILPLPLTGDLKIINQSCNTLRKSLDPLTNHYLLKLCNICPKCILEPVFNSNQATMVFSNIPGPKSLSICGCAMQSMVFFVPNKGSTGVGVTALCYGGVLRFAIMADSALLSNPEDLSIIINGMVQKIGSLHKDYVTT